MQENNEPSGAQAVSGNDVPDLADDAKTEALRIEMLRFATLQLRDTALAEDAVQESLLAAYAAASQFEGRSRFKTWVFSILRNKIVDVLRERGLHAARHSMDEAGADKTLDQEFDDRGYWRPDRRPAAWGQPEEALDSDQFWSAFEVCLDQLPEAAARVFMMREFTGLETAQICAELTITESNCWVILHRARLRLRRCLEQSWVNRGN